MKRSGPPARRTGLTTRRPLGSNGRRPLKPGGPLRPISDARDADSGRRAAVRQVVFLRDHQRCRLRGAPGFPNDCLGPLTAHHLRKEGQGGRYVASNLLTLCAAHNDAVEVMPRDDMVAAGLVIPAWHLDPCRAWALLQLQGIVAWWWDGTPVDQPCPGRSGAA